MPRGNHIVEPAETFRLWIRRVEQENRLRLPRLFGRIIPWIGESYRVDCVAFLGRKGGLSVAPMPSLRRHKAAVERLRRIRFTPEGTAEQLIEYARYAATNWPVTVRQESGRYTVTLPEEPRNIGLLPSTGGYAAVFAIDDILEIWPAKDWVAHIRDSEASLERLRDQIDQLIDGDD
jgi:hypothetical protein